MSVAQEIHDKLSVAFSPVDLQVVDDSASHAGHAGHASAPGGGESHFNVRIRAAVFVDQNRLVRHRAVHAALGEDLLCRIHALSLDIDTP
ncbi:MAG: BolA family transcriptional regulator [Shimia sp.]|nr:BolA family transcriptional regulator [Shimia sp.]